MAHHESEELWRVRLCLTARMSSTHILRFALQDGIHSALQTRTQSEQARSSPTGHSSSVEVTIREAFRQVGTDFAKPSRVEMGDPPSEPMYLVQLVLRAP